MAKAVAKSKKTVAKAAVKSAAKSKSSVRPKAVAVAPSARKALKKVPAKPIAKPVAKPAAKPAAKKAAVAKPAAEAVKAGKWVYSFGGGKSEGKSEMRNLLGGKGANLAEMANLGLPVPPGFTIPTSVCTYYYDNKNSYPKELKAQVEKALETVGKISQGWVLDLSLILY